jgi:hypothetical protein
VPAEIEPHEHDGTPPTIGLVPYEVPSYACLMFGFVRRVFGCRHNNSIREHRADGWYWACSTCGRAGLLNPRQREIPRAVGQYDERKAAAGKARAENATAQRHAAAHLSERTYSRKAPSTSVLPLRRAR